MDIISSHQLMSALVGIQFEPPSVIYKAFKSGSAIDTSEKQRKFLFQHKK